MTTSLLRGDARSLPLADSSVDLIVTSPPYFGLRDYGTPGQLGAEPTPGQFVDALIECTREMVRVLKPSGSIFVNLGDKYAGSGGFAPNAPSNVARREGQARSAFHGASSEHRRQGTAGTRGARWGIPSKSLALLPERYRIAAVDELGLIARAVLVWSKPNVLPESVTDRVRRSHEDWVHLTKAPRYFASVDEIREPHSPVSIARAGRAYNAGDQFSVTSPNTLNPAQFVNPLGKLPGSVWDIATQPLKVPAELGVDHYAAFPMEWPRRLILGWSPREVCIACGEGRRAVTHSQRTLDGQVIGPGSGGIYGDIKGVTRNVGVGNRHRTDRTITGYACACADTSAPSTPGVVLDPFGGTGTTALVASMLGRHGISVDLSTDYQRIAEWRTQDPKQRERATRPANPRRSAS